MLVFRNGMNRSPVTAGLSGKRVRPGAVAVPEQHGPRRAGRTGSLHCARRCTAAPGVRSDWTRRERLACPTIPRTGRRPTAGRPGTRRSSADVVAGCDTGGRTSAGERRKVAPRAKSWLTAEVVEVVGSAPGRRDPAGSGPTSCRAGCRCRDGEGERRDSTGSPPSSTHGHFRRPA
jgi:hypothetical protein